MISDIVFDLVIWPIASDPGILHFVEGGRGASKKNERGAKKKGQVMDIRLVFSLASFSSKSMGDRGFLGICMRLTFVYVGSYVVQY